MCLTDEGGAGPERSAVASLVKVVTEQLGEMKEKARILLLLERNLMCTRLKELRKTLRMAARIGLAGHPLYKQLDRRYAELLELREAALGTAEPRAPQGQDRPPLSAPDSPVTARAYSTPAAVSPSATPTAARSPLTSPKRARGGWGANSAARRCGDEQQCLGGLGKGRGEVVPEAWRSRPPR